MSHPAPNHRVAFLRWLVHGRVIDNHGDVGVCWRLARSLARMGDQVDLVLDDPSALAFMAPHVTLGTWRHGVRVRRLNATPQAAPLRAGEEALHSFDVVVEAFGSGLPSETQSILRTMPVPPPWFNLEYLSAESYVERSHGLPSPQQHGPLAGLVSHFYYPGFNNRTGGLMLDARALHEPNHALDIPTSADLETIELVRRTRAPGEQLVSVFAYDHARLEPLLSALGPHPTLMLAFAGPVQERLQHLLSSTHARVAGWPSVRMLRLPYVSQVGFDRLLALADLNIVRGEDSFVSAIQARRPFLWNIYAQHDGAHGPKLHAWLDQLAPAMAHEPAAWEAVRAHTLSLNRLGTSEQSLSPSVEPIDMACWQRLFDPWFAAQHTLPPLQRGLRQSAVDLGAGRARIAGFALASHANPAGDR